MPSTKNKLKRLLHLKLKGQSRWFHFNNTSSNQGLVEKSHGQKTLNSFETQVSSTRTWVFLHPHENTIFVGKLPQG